MTPDNEVRFRACLDDVPAYKPGRPPERSDGRPAYKLSSNENPYPPLPGVLAAATEAAAQMNRYPDMGAVELLEALSARFGVPVSDLAVGTGSVALLYHLLQATVTEGDEVVYAWRSFEAYPIAVQLTGATSVQVPLTAAARHDFKAMEAAITDRTKVVLVCTPNNPTGPVVRRDELIAFLAAVPPNVLVVVDEAYREFVRETDVVDGVELYRDRPNVLVLRTFSKAYGLAGFRVGYAIGHPPVVAAIRKCALPFGVSYVAQAAAIASLGVEDELFARVDALVEERRRVVGALTDAGWQVPESETNFVWLELGEDTVEFAAAVQAEGVSVRPFPGDGVRVTIGEPEANNLFLEVARNWRK
ncbi:histidinol-phosphate transaminase [Kribbella solani]|uniref:histidinol-phosphate transaminase n=1 Tax=Kribbella solani TaxID=236067 RepID=UPI0029B770B4|nr:histidinol-phosphate transaminase [Kribbella solani]MDX2973148.1 histidinol-phosphate transaminase [Kribbella solani]MDX3003970.1 histidinol-phosphate transaminase [Kribbella solani]